MSVDHEIVLKIDGLCKSFGSTKANVDINMEFRRGEIHGIAGENGSGKSTLLSQLAGMQSSDAGELTLFGKPYKPHSPLDAIDNKISMVVQELGIIGNLPAGINIYLGRMDEIKKNGMINMRMMQENIKKVLEKWDLPSFPLSKNCGSMSIEQRKMVELTRALSSDPEILILDEITQALSLNNRNKLYEIIKVFKDAGKTIILITHDIEEMVEITDRITVMRDGHVIETLNSKETTPNEIKTKMVNREVGGHFYREDNTPSRGEKIAVEVRGLNSELLHDVSFDVYEGEILGFCGLSDAGIHDIGKLMYGLIPDKKRSVHMVKDDIYITSPKVALRNGMGYLPKDRDGEGLMMDNDICDNFCMPSYDELSGGFRTLTNRVMNRVADDSIARFNVKTSDGFQKMNSLSGGNKQKVNLGRWLIKDEKVLILDCPTRGVDIGVKAYIYEEMVRAKEAGLAIVLISDELLEVLGMADRLMVVKEGQVVREIQRGKDFTEENVIEVMI